MWMACATDQEIADSVDLEKVERHKGNCRFCEYWQTCRKSQNLEEKGEAAMRLRKSAKSPARNSARLAKPPDWTRFELSTATNVPLWFIAAFEDGRSTPDFLVAYEVNLRAALEAACVEFSRA